MLLKEMVRLKNASRYSWHGLKAAWHDAGAFRLEVCLTPIVILAASYLTDELEDFFILLIFWLLVPLTELLNTGIEAAVDLACKGEVHPLAKKAKDCGSAAVTLALCIFALSWLAVLIS